MRGGPAPCNLHSRGSWLSPNWYSPNWAALAAALAAAAEAAGPVPADTERVQGGTPHGSVSLPAQPPGGVSAHLPHRLGHLLHQGLLLLWREDGKSVPPFLKDGVSLPPGTLCKQTGGQGHVTQWKEHRTEVHSQTPTRQGQAPLGFGLPISSPSARLALGGTGSHSGGCELPRRLVSGSDSPGFESWFLHS